MEMRGDGLLRDKRQTSNVREALYEPLVVHERRQTWTAEQAKGVKGNRTKTLWHDPDEPDSSSAAPLVSSRNSLVIAPQTPRPSQLRRLHPSALLQPANQQVYTKYKNARLKKSSHFRITESPIRTESMQRKQIIRYTIGFFIVAFHHRSSSCCPLVTITLSVLKKEERPCSSPSLIALLLIFPSPFTPRNESSAPFCPPCPPRNYTQKDRRLMKKGCMFERGVIGRCVRDF